MAARLGPFGYDIMTALAPCGAVVEGAKYRSEIAAGAHRQHDAARAPTVRREKMFELLVIVLFIWLAVKAVGLALRLTWGVAKLLASILFVVAVPLLIGCVLFAGGLLLLVPLLLVAAAVAILKVCV